MTTTDTTGVRRTGALAALVLTASLLVAAPTAAQEPATTRYGGASRFETAVAVSAGHFSPGADVVYVATGEGYADALAGGPLAGRDEAPILLVGRDAVPDVTAEELRRLQPDSIVVLGGEAAVGPAVVDALQGIAPTTRLAGDSRFETAAAIARAGFDPGVDTVYVATGGNYPDALAGAAAGAAVGAPVLLVATDAVPDATAAELERLEPGEIVLLGGAAAVSEAVAEQLGAFTAGPVRRLAGDSRFATAAAVAGEFGAPTQRVFLATGGNFPDALAGAPAAALTDSPLLLTRPECVPDEVLAAIGDLDPEEIVVLGGEGVVSPAAASLTPCAAAGELPPSTFTVDEGIELPVAELPPHPDGGPRDVARMVSTNGMPVDFVVGEVIVQPDDDAQLQAFLSQYGGEVLETIEHRDIEGFPTTHLVRIDPARADADALAADAAAIADGRWRGDVTVSSDAGLRTIAATADATADGLVVAGHVLHRPDQADFVGRVSTEATNGEDFHGVEYTSNAFGWPYIREGGPQDTGVGEAWRLLDIAGALEPATVDVAILDTGFGTGEWAVATGPSDCTEERCDHGTAVANVAAAVPGNGTGIAGPAGPVARLNLHEIAIGDFFVSDFETIGALGLSILDGTDVLNMSYGYYLDAAVNWWAVPMGNTTAIAANWMSIFASAGNDDLDVDDRQCVGPVCWESEQKVPCELAGVTCVGGTAFSGFRATYDTGSGSGSNYGHEWCGDARCDVELFGPYATYIGRVASQGSDSALTVGHGTSFASPFVAGVAALVYAANPDLSPTDVTDLLIQTGRIDNSDDNTISRYVDAFAAVSAALGEVGPQVTITAPEDGAQFGTFAPIDLRADAVHPSGQPMEIVWTAQRSGDGSTVTIGPGAERQHTFDPGEWAVTATATAPDGTSDSATVTITVGNPPPEIDITNPGNGETLQAGVPAQLRAVLGQSLVHSCHSVTVSWTVSPQTGDFPRQGCETTGTFSQPGSYTITATATDSEGQVDSDSVTVSVVDPPDDQLVVTITSPSDGGTTGGSSVTLSGQVQYGDGSSAGGATYRWLARALPDGQEEVVAEGTVDGTRGIRAATFSRPGCGGGSGGTFEFTLSVRDGLTASGSDRITHTLTGIPC